METKLSVCEHKCIFSYRENEINECGLDLVFATDMEVLGKVTEYELKENGKNIEVNDENKHEYIE